ncbi:hypothetical protein Leryth_017044 [Lithospermum erythrorhizon]|nr:hypothetical protein Leryth_017044 [Lithospermum erythrorhizon]
MAQAQPEREIRAVEENVALKHDNNNSDNNKKKKKKKKYNDMSSKTGGGGGGGAFKFNAHAPEYVPKSTPAVPVSGYIVPCLQYGGGSAGADKWIFVSDKDVIPLVANPDVSIPTSQCTNNNNAVLTEQLQNKIIKQVEYQFSDMSLLANDNLAKQIRKDPEGFVPIAVVSSTKKLKSIISTNYNLLAEALCASTKLDVSNDGQRVKRKNPFTEKEREELQLRTVVAENLPDDHSHQNLEKIFNVAGAVKTIRVCHPQEANSRGKGDCVVSTKLHALVEFENMESAEKAVEKLNDERNWGKGLRVRLLLRRSPRSVLKNRKAAFDGHDGYLDEEEGHQVEGGLEDNSQLQQQNNTKPFALDNNAEDAATSSKKAMWSKGRGRPQQQRSSTSNGRGLLSQSSLPVNSESSAKQTIKGPRMPDGTKGFNMGRGRPISIPV